MSIATSEVNSSAPTDHNAPGPSFLSIRNVVKQFNDLRVVNDVTLDIHQGEIFVLLGGSGCGKSTLLRMLAGFETPTSGQITLNGRDLLAIPPHQRPINMMFQSYALFPHLTVWDNIAFGLRREGRPKAEIMERVEYLLGLVQLKDYARRKPHQLSGGQQQRVALARSLSRKPQILLLDEPLGALDKKLRERTQVELVNIIEQVGVTCVMVTHDQEEAMSMATRIGIMGEGRILQVGNASQIYETPTSRYVANFIGSVNLFDGVVLEDSADHIVIQSADCMHYVNHGVAIEEGVAVSAGLRPEKIFLSTDFPAGFSGSSPNCAHGEIVECTYLGSHTDYRVRLASGMLLKVSGINSFRHAAQLEVGHAVYATWNADDIMILTH